jgi:hypothetical protein
MPQEKKMKRTFVMAAAALAALSCSIGATAQTMQQDRNQHRRIQQGVRSGELSRSETRYLRQQNRYIARLKHHYMRDGNYTARERNNIRMREQRMNRRIYRMKHN